MSITFIGSVQQENAKKCDMWCETAFIHSTLPDDEEYFLRPPLGCPCSKPGQYWHLLWPHYRLKNLLQKSPCVFLWEHFPVPHQVSSMSDAKWRPQDVSQSHSNMELPLFPTRSMLALYIDLLGPIHWLSKHHSHYSELCWSRNICYRWVH